MSGEAEQSDEGDEPTRADKLRRLAETDPVTAGILATWKLAAAEEDAREPLAALAAVLTSAERAEADAYASVRRRLAKLDRSLAKAAAKPAPVEPASPPTDPGTERRDTARALTFFGVVGVLVGAVGGASGNHVVGMLGWAAAAVLFLLGTAVRLSAGAVPSEPPPPSRGQLEERSRADRRRERIAFLLTPEVRRVRALVRKHPRLGFDALGE